MMGNLSMHFVGMLAFTPSIPICTMCACAAVHGGGSGSVSAPSLSSYTSTFAS